MSTGTPPTTKQKINATGFENRLKVEAPHLSKGQRKAAAKRIAWRMQHATRWVDAPVETVYEEGLRILGILPDITARDAVRNLEAVSA